MEVHFYTEKLTFSKENSPMQERMLHILGAFAQFEHMLIKERQLEGIDNANRMGKYLGSPKKLSDEDKKIIFGMHKNSCTPYFIAEKFNVSISSVYKTVIKKGIILYPFLVCVIWKTG